MHISIITHIYHSKIDYKHNIYIHIYKYVTAACCAEVMTQRCDKKNIF